MAMTHLKRPYSTATYCGKTVNRVKHAFIAQDATCPMCLARHEAETMPRLTIPDDAWEESGEAHPWGRLLAQITINGLHLHVEAIAVEDDENGDTRAIDPSFESNLNGLAELAEPSGAWDTLTIRGRDGVEREYVVFATPHC